MDPRKWMTKRSLAIKEAREKEQAEAKELGITVEALRQRKLDELRFGKKADEKAGEEAKV